MLALFASAFLASQAVWGLSSFPRRWPPLLARRTGVPSDERGGHEGHATGEQQHALAQPEQPLTRKLLRPGGADDPRTESNGAT